MYIFHLLCLFLAMGSVVPASPQPAIIAHAIQRNALVYATMAPRADGNQEVEEKLDRGPAQKVLMGCPEMFNEPVHSCSSCGGESATIRGQCKIANGSKFYCKCTFIVIRVPSSIWSRHIGTNLLTRLQHRPERQNNDCGLRHYEDRCRYWHI